MLHWLEGKQLADESVKSNDSAVMMIECLEMRGWSPEILVNNICCCVRSFSFAEGRLLLCRYLILWQNLCQVCHYYHYNCLRANRPLAHYCKTQWVLFMWRVYRVYRIFFRFCVFICLRIRLMLRIFFYWYVEQEDLKCFNSKHQQFYLSHILSAVSAWNMWSKWNYWVLNLRHLEFDAST